MTVVDKASPEPGGGTGSGDAADPARYQARIRRNDYSALQPPAIGDWTPRLCVSVVVPAYGNAEKLGLVLAALAAQTYPPHLLEAVVVDDGTDPPLSLPEIRPTTTRIVRPNSGVWGPSHAVNAGVAASDGEVVLRLDSDMLVYRDHVESQLRWHHLADYLGVLGHKRFVNHAPGKLAPQHIYEAVRHGRAAELFKRDMGGELWIEKILDRTDTLRSAGHRAYQVFTGATCSMRRDLFNAVGGMDATLVLGEDVELGYRLAQAGAVFVPDLDSSGWHLGQPQMRARREEGTRYRTPYVAHRVPDSHLRRNIPGRQWQVPYVDVVISVDGHPWERVCDTVDGLLAGEKNDIRIVLVGPWATLDAASCRAPLDDPRIDLRLLRETYRLDSRIRLSDAPPNRDVSVPFRLTLPADSRPTRQTLSTLIDIAEKDGAGLVCVLSRRTRSRRTSKGAAHPRLERTAAFARAYHLGATADDIDEVVDEIYGVRWVDGSRVFAGDPPKKKRNPAEPPTCPACSGQVEAAQRLAERERARADRLERRLRWLRGAPTSGFWRRVLSGG
ncbi:hypothetical protein CDO52_07335 [Nocardiopsis gilva YIM 90087]|uniref:Glycosyltransferase 2-like domain-containing protein n=1 Tax=Nocardiopsis gilva YIM 90087 TaxID=1235441 RepID=A0A223S3C6_9ACTN|nr:glycosyltransferase [Nocardiopsis gilva]ASU82621.1 hypothetical protein CDO52_07335 [Nocardiopsis gilva YIM 90087]